MYVKFLIGDAFFYVFFTFSPVRTFFFQWVQSDGFTRIVVETTWSFTVSHYSMGRKGLRSTHLTQERAILTRRAGRLYDLIRYTNALLVRT
jgi:dTDP-4-dehydrorhamnose 3,5-epimerase-like enzyme